MAFLNAFLSYGLLLLIFVCVGALAIFVGITMRKKKDASIAATSAEEVKE